MTDQSRKLEFEVEVEGTPEEVWAAIATGPGISSWYVPHQVEEREGGAASAWFGTGPEMEVPGRVAAWEPPDRIVFDGGEGVEGLAFEWLVEARSGTCVVRLVNTGFGSGDEWDAQYDGMAEGWKMFLLNLQLHLRHFRGQTAVASLPSAYCEGDAGVLWARLLSSFDTHAPPEVGQGVTFEGAPNLRLAGTVVDVGATRVSLLTHEPAPGTAFIVSEQVGPHVSVSVWSYLYGAEGAHAAARDEPMWQRWLDDAVAEETSA